MDDGNQEAKSNSGRKVCQYGLGQRHDGFGMELTEECKSDLLCRYYLVKVVLSWSVLLRKEPGNHRSDEDRVIAHRRLAPVL